jgi:outer membrane protein assembly factor BamB
VKTVVTGALLLLFTLSACQFDSQTESQTGDSNWPGFRGQFARGISENSSLPTKWDVKNGQNIKWKIDVPGLGFSSPVIWKDRLFITTAISGLADPELKVGLYGNIDPVEDETVHQWKVLCFNKNNGELIWDRTACTGVPKVKRHPKSTHANPTIATDGYHIVAFFGSEGLYCYDMDGNLLWKRDLGILDSGFFLVPDAQWGFASSPVIYKDRVIIQCDVLENSFIASLNIKTGEDIWRKSRDEVPTWSTPTIHQQDNQTQIIVNGFKHIGGYDVESGNEIWKMAGGGDIPVPTPVVAHDLIFINNAHGGQSPIYAIKVAAQGDISLHDNATSNENISWSVKTGGSYMLSPLVYGDYLYNCRGNGSLKCFNAKTGEEVYKQSLKGDSFTASAVAAGENIYYSGENGTIYVLKAGPEFKLLSKNNMEDICMATPAISGNTIYFRTKSYLVAVSEI